MVLQKSGTSFFYFFLHACRASSIDGKTDKLGYLEALGREFKFYVKKDGVDVNND
jgi:hypothetical protein